MVSLRLTPGTELSFLYQVNSGTTVSQYAYHFLSDSRSAQIVDERIRPALESGSMIGSKKPTLLVIDEIDGATGGTDTSGGFIHKLVQLIQEKPRRKGTSHHVPLAISQMTNAPVMLVLQVAKNRNQHFQYSVPSFASVMTFMLVR